MHVMYKDINFLMSTMYDIEVDFPQIMWHADGNCAIMHTSLDIGDVQNW